MWEFPALSPNSLGASRSYSRDDCYPPVASIRFTGGNPTIRRRLSGDPGKVLEAFPGTGNSPGRCGRFAKFGPPRYASLAAPGVLGGILFLSRSE